MPFIIPVNGRLDGEMETYLNHVNGIDLIVNICQVGSTAICRLSMLLLLLLKR